MAVAYKVFKNMGLVLIPVRLFKTTADYIDLRESLQKSLDLSKFCNLSGTA